MYSRLDGTRARAHRRDDHGRRTHVHHDQVRLSLDVSISIAMTRFDNHPSHGWIDRHPLSTRRWNGMGRRM